MDTIKDKAFLCLVIGIIGIEVIYLMVFYRKNEASIIQTTKEIQLAQTRIQLMEEQSKQLPKIEEDLVRAEANKQDLLNKMPSYTGHAKYMAELVQYMKLNDFSNIEYREVKVETVEHMIQSEYALTFTGSYDKILGFIDYLNESNQIICIKDLKLDRSMQDVAYENNQEELQYSDAPFIRQVEVSLQMSIYWRQNQSQEDQQAQ